MALHLDLGGEDPVGGPDAHRVADIGHDHRMVGGRAERLAHGALICPTCSLPVMISAPLAVGSPLRCGFCTEVAPAHRFLVRDAYDTTRNEVYLVARLGHSA